MKTIEEIRESVLAYCEEVCPIMDSEYVMSPGTKLVHRVLKGDWTQWELQCWNGGTCQWERSFCASPYMGEDDPHFGYLYRIFGLEARDAVAAEKRETERVRTSLNHAIALKNEQIQKRLIESNADRNDLEAIIDHERARNTALVKALEEIRKPAMIIGFGKKATVKMRIDQLFEDHKRVRLIAKNALAANTEKGGVQG